MHDPLLVCCLERVRDLTRNRDGLGNRNGPARDPVGERFTLSQFQHERAKASVFLDAVDGRDVGMFEGGERLRFALEPRETLGATILHC